MVQSAAPRPINLCPTCPKLGLCVGEVTIETQARQFTPQTGGSYEGVQLIVKDSAGVAEAGQTFVPTTYEVPARKGKVERRRTFEDVEVRDDTIFGSLALNPDVLLTAAAERAVHCKQPFDDQRVGPFGIITHENVCRVLAPGVLRTIAEGILTRSKTPQFER